MIRDTENGQAMLVDPGAEAARILRWCVDVQVVGIVLTHAHFDHVMALPQLTSSLDVPVYAHPAEVAVWRHERATLSETGHWDGGTATATLLAADPSALTPAVGEALWNGIFEPLTNGQTLPVGNVSAGVLHTPGHTPGGVTLTIEGHLLTGDTLFPGGPGLTGPALSDFSTIIASVQRLLDYPGHTIIHPGHGEDSTIGTEKPHLNDWVRRGW